MAEPTDDRTGWQSEGWAVRQRRGVAAAVAIPVVLLLALLFFGAWYGRTLRPLTVQHVIPFPRPGAVVEHAPATRDPDVPAPRPSPDPRLQAAERQVVTDGIAGWPEPRR